MVFYVYNKRQITLWTWVLLFFCFPAFLIPAQAPPAVGRAPQKLISLNFRDAPLDQVLDFYGELTGRTMIKAPNVNATITLRGQTRLTEEEALKAITSILAMNNISLVPMGEKFFKVVQIASARQEGMELEFFDPEAAQDSDRLVSQLITLDFIEITEAQPVVQGLLHGYGKIQALERINSLLVTDTENNLQRIMEILDFIDQPVSTRVETRIYEIQYAEAGKIGSSLKELIQESQKEEKETVEAPKAATPPGVIRARSRQDTATGEVLSAAELAQRGIVQGKVKIITDERTNILIVISEPENFVFFDKIVAVLDRPVEPEIEVKVVALEYADAEEISGILNEFIGAATKKDGQSGSGGGKSGDGDGGATALEQFIRQRADSRVASTDEGKASIGELSEKTKILADTRSNALLLMGRKSDISALMDVIKELDIMLSQVLIEAVILEVGLSESFEYGIDWLQRSLTAYNVDSRGPGGGVKVRQPVMSFGGGQRLSEGTTFQDGSQITRTSPTLSPGALTYFTTFFDFNIDAVLRLAAGNSDTKILSTPVILTTDNTEAKIVVGEERPVVTSSSTTSAGEQRSTYEYKNIGINLTVTPRINPQGYVVMEIAQTVDNVGDETVIDGNSVPIITKRELNASVSVPSRSTIVLGGLISNDRRLGRAKVPLLGDIPLLGALFRSDSRSKTRRELMILITPYVLESPRDSYKLTERLHHATRGSDIIWPENWSESPLATLPPERIREIRKQNKKEKQLELRMKLDVPTRSQPKAVAPDEDMPEEKPDGEEAGLQPAIKADDPAAWVSE